MRRCKSLLFLLTVTLFNSVCAQNKETCSTCLPQGITFTTQEQINNFQTNYPGCTVVAGYLKIQGSNSITNLDGLSGLTSIGGNLNITGSFSLANITGLSSLTSIGGNLEMAGLQLTSLAGLENLSSIGGNLKIGNCNSFTDISSLSNLDSIGGDLEIIINGDLINLDGLNNLIDFTGDINISYNNSLILCQNEWLCQYLSNPQGKIFIYDNAVGCNSIMELAIACSDSIPCLPFGDYTFSSQADIDNFQTEFPDCADLNGGLYITGDFISGNDITNLQGLSQITSIANDVSITENTSLANFIGLDNLISIGGNLILNTNSSLISFNGLNNLESIGGRFDAHIEGSSIQNFTGLESLQTIGNSLGISSTELVSLSGLENLQSIGGWLAIGYDEYGNSDLENIDALSNLTSIGGPLVVTLNPSLTSLSGLDNIAPGSISELMISLNPSLSTCQVLSICEYLSGPDPSAVFGYNATGCNSEQEVKSACLQSSNDNIQNESAIAVYPNPANSFIVLEIPVSSTLTILNLDGKELLYKVNTGSQTMIDISSLQNGIYFLKVTGEDFLWNGKFVKTSN